MWRKLYYTVCTSAMFQMKSTRLTQLSQSKFEQFTIQTVASKPHLISFLLLLTKFLLLTPWKNREHHTLYISQEIIVLIDTITLPTYKASMNSNLFSKLEENRTFGNKEKKIRSLWRHNKWSLVRDIGTNSVGAIHECLRNWNIEEIQQTCQPFAPYLHLEIYD